ncbi:TetR/AcrR family transcriptional regulator [Salisediminibacterium beveridgei]|uniref:Transcriptional regulator, TetR family n=1 Tax=Salisediminibacterium beveridgei TaxID=632773 RepID=A0A1D7QZ22_9BACI|nr:TetR-like C-terminal domain-containing protein [Salisediminibacterium beveridgei]AOM84263.1 Transcriptional regulator, TetR family [Salisediminibacterium beveridgei]
MAAKMDRRVKYTLEVIESSFLELMQQKPLSHITVKELCQKADINRSTFYAHYEDLSALLNAIQDRIIYDAEEMLNTYDYTQDTEALVMTTRLMTYLSDNQRNSQTLFSDHGDTVFQRKLITMAHRHLIQSFTADPAIHEDRHVDYLSTFITQGSIAMIQHWLQKGMKETPEEIAVIITRIAKAGIDDLMNQ